MRSGRQPATILLSTLAAAVLAACAAPQDGSGDSGGRDFVREVNETIGRWGQWVNNQLGVGDDDAGDLDRTVERELEDGGEGSRRWKGSQSGVEATIDTRRIDGEKSSETRNVRRDVVVPSDLLEREGVYVTRSRTNVRLGPGTRHGVAQTLPAGHRVKVVAETRSGWYMLETGDTVIGFIFGRLLEPAPVSVPYGSADDAPAPKPALPYGGTTEEAGGTERPALPYGPAGNDEPAVPLEQGAAEPTRIEVERQCREISVTLDDGRSQTHTVCREADGSWRRPER